MAPPRSAAPRNAGPATPNHLDTVKTIVRVIKGNATFTRLTTEDMEHAVGLFQGRIEERDATPRATGLIETINMMMDIAGVDVFLTREDIKQAVIYHIYVNKHYQPPAPQVQQQEDMEQDDDDDNRSVQSVDSDGTLDDSDNESNGSAKKRRTNGGDSTADADA